MNVAYTDSVIQGDRLIWRAVFITEPFALGPSTVPQIPITNVVGLPNQKLLGVLYDRNPYAKFEGLSSELQATTQQVIASVY